MRRVIAVLGVSMLSMSACSTDVVNLVDDSGAPAPPLAVAADYFAGSVTVTWELSPAWNGEAFRVYSRRLTDADLLFIAEVTSCIQDFCSYEDLNVVPDESYEYLVSAVNGAGVETDAAETVEVFVPQPVAPPVPDLPAVVALDHANFVTWGDGSRAAGDFSHYKVYLDDSGGALLLGETDSEGFLDLLAENGVTSGYFATAVDSDGHESEGSAIAQGTPRPDFAGELLYDFADVPGSSGFLFAEDESVVPVVDGSDFSGFDFRLENDASGWWLVAGADAEIFPSGFPTTALKCGPAADAECVDVVTAPLTGYDTQDVQLFTETSYVLRVPGAEGQVHYGVIRVTHLGADQNGDLMIFDWAFQLQAGNPDLVSPRGG